VAYLLVDVATFKLIVKSVFTFFTLLIDFTVVNCVIVLIKCLYHCFSVACVYIYGEGPKNWTIVEVYNSCI